MEDCPLAAEFVRNPMSAREFVENHSRLPVWIRLFHALVSMFVQ